MLKHKTYFCGICKTTPDQISHHKSHLGTQKHKDKYELFELKLSNLSEAELENRYKTTNIKTILTEIETVIYSPIIKLNCDELPDEDYTTEYNLKIKMIEQSTSASNKEALKDKIHEIHNYLRNNGAGYGMNALKVFNVLYGLKKIEENGLFDKIDFEPQYRFSNLVKMANNLDIEVGKEEKLAEFIKQDVLNAIYKNPKLKDLLFYEIPQKMKSNSFAYLIKEINKITSIEKNCNVLLSGKIYEYFIGRDESAISELGAYFTDRHITKYSLEKANITRNEDGTIKTMIDMFGGSGGFTTEYVNHLNTEFPKMINWDTEIDKVYHFDMNEDVIKSAGLELFCLTGSLPDMKNNVASLNSFTTEFANKKYNYVFTNPPYGGDKNKKSDRQNKNSKVKEYIKNELLTITDEGLRIKRQKQLKRLEAQEKQDKKDSEKNNVSLISSSHRINKFSVNNGKLKGNDKESCSLMLIMDILEVGGTSVSVLKEGVFFNKAYKDLRKCLVENFNVREVISVPQDQFENTSTKTSILVFENTPEKTKSVKFSELSVERYTEDKFAEILDEIIVIENKGDIKGVSDKLISEATREEILKNPIYSLNGKDYNKKEIIVGEGYELVKLGDICEFNKYKSQKSDENGKKNYYTCSNTIQKCITGNIKGEFVIMGTRGTITEALHYINDEFGCGNNMLLFNSNKYNNKYIYYMLLSQKNNIKTAITGSTIPMISMNKFKDVLLSIPKSESKIKEWVDKISTPYNEKNTKQTKIKELEAFIQNRIIEIGDNEECDEVELGSVCEIKSGKAINSENRKGNLYPYYAANGISGFVDNYLFDGKFVICAQDGSIGATHLVNCKFYASNHVWVLKIVNINPYYIYSILKNNIDYSKITSGSVIPKLTKENLSKIKIRIPKNKQHITDLEITFQQIETLQNEVKVAEDLYKQLIQELSNEAIPQQVDKNTEPVDIVENLSIPSEKIVKNKSKSKKNITKNTE